MSNRRASCFFFVLTVAVAVTQGAFTQLAEAAAKRRVGVSISGTPAGPIKEAVSDVLKKHGFEATTPDLSGDSEDAIAAAAKQGKLAAVIVGEVREGGKRVKLRVYSSSGELIGEGSWAEKGGPKKLGATVERTLWARVGGSLSKARPPGGGSEKAAKPEPAEEAAPPEAAPTYSRSKDTDAEPAAESESPRAKKKAAKKREEEDASDSGPASPAAGPALDLQVGPRFVSRDLTWKQVDSPARLSPYSLGMAPALGVSVAWFPAAHFMGGWMSNLGLAFSAEYVPGVTSKTSDGAKYPTQLSDYNGGVRGRLAFGPVRGALTLGAGQHAMIFRNGTLPDGSPASRQNLSQTPDVKYLYARVGADLRVQLPLGLSVALGGGYRYVISAGDVNYLLQTDLFLPDSKVSAFDVAFGAGYRLMSLLEVRAGFDLRRYQISAGTNTHMVTSGTDQFMAFWAALALTLDGPTGDSTAAPRSASKKAEKVEETGDAAAE